MLLLLLLPLPLLLPLLRAPRLPRAATKQMMTHLGDLPKGFKSIPTLMKLRTAVMSLMPGVARVYGAACARSPRPPQLPD